VIGELRKFDSFVVITPDPYLCADALLHGVVPYQVIDRESRVAGLKTAFDFEVPDHEIFGGLTHKPFPSFNQAVEQVCIDVDDELDANFQLTKVGADDIVSKALAAECVAGKATAYQLCVKYQTDQITLLRTPVLEPLEPTPIREV